MRLAVLDLGSTSFHLLVADGDADGCLQRVLRDRQRVGLGGVLARDRPIPEDDAARAVEAAARLHDLALRAGADETVVVATAALRDSRNGWAVLGAIETATGQPVIVLDGAEEARYAFTGISAAVGLPPGPVLGADLGGGSFELALGGRAGVGVTASLDLGVERLAEEFVSGARPSASEMQRIKEVVLGELRTSGVPIADAQEVVVAGGWSRAVAKVAAGVRWGELPPAINRLTLDAPELWSLASYVGSMTPERRTSLPGVKQHRAAALPVAVTILLALAEESPEHEVVVSDWGLREGVLLDALGAGRTHPPTRARVRQTAVERLAAGLSHDAGHARHVAHLAGQLAERLGPALGLDPGVGGLVAFAGFLHEVGVSVSADGHHRHSAYVIEQARLRGFTPQEIAMLATMVRFHTGGRPKSSFAPFATLGEEQRRQTMAATALLQVADALDRTRGAEVEEVWPEAHGDPCVLVVDGPGVYGHDWSALGPFPLLEEALGRPVEIETRQAVAAGA